VKLVGERLQHCTPRDLAASRAAIRIKRIKPNQTAEDRSNTLPLSGFPWGILRSIRTPRKSGTS
jgi:hypothetical protein